MKEIDDMFNSEHHFLLGVNIPSVSLVNPDSWVKHYWGPDKIQSEKVCSYKRCYEISVISAL
jgi:hypothetical protein